jgi:predicted component of viral defense system (DUF524 family)
VTRLRGQLDGWLGRSFLPDIARPDILPLGSPVLQRKSGYRELLHTWLQFHVGAQLAWDGGQDVWQGGARNVALLYEYWLFFQLEALFRAKFACVEPLHSVLIENDAGLLRLKLQRGVELRTPVGGVWSQRAGRRLAAEFHFNRKFVRSQPHNHDRAGSWTRGVQPDYTISIWPADFTREEAEANASMVHTHFDAKYRVDFARTLFGDENNAEEISDRAESLRETPTAANMLTCSRCMPIEMLSGALPAPTCSIRAMPVTGNSSRSLQVSTRCCQVWARLPSARGRMARPKAWTICAASSTM